MKSPELTEQEMYGQVRVASGGVFPVEGWILYEYAKQHGGPVLEIGGCQGVSTRFIAGGLRARGNGKVLSVDKNHQWAPGSTWPEIVHITSMAHRVYLGRCEWAFIDGDHSKEGVLSDIATAKRHECRLAVFHDGLATICPGVREAIAQAGYTPTELGGPAEMLEVIL